MRIIASAFLLLVLNPCAWGQDDTPLSSAFGSVRLYVDSGETSLAAYQLELKAASGNVKIVGIEGGDSPAFADPPHYDPKAMMGDRVILAAFSTGKNLPTGRTRVATVHYRLTGRALPTWELKPVITAGPQGQPVASIMSVAATEE